MKYAIALNVYYEIYGNKVDSATHIVHPSWERSIFDRFDSS